MQGEPTDPQAAAAHFNRGVELEKANDLQAARHAYEQALVGDPRHAEALASLAWLDAQTGDTSSARRRGEQALTLEPGNVLARMAVAWAELQDKQLDSAGQRLAALYPDPAVTPLNRAIVLGLVGDLNDARDDMGRAFTAYEAANAQ